MNGESPEAAPERVESPPPDPEPQPDVNPAREISAHLLHMLETRIDAAGVAIEGETHLLKARLQLRLLAGAAIFFAIWGGIVLLAIALPENLRIPVLAAVVGAFVLTAVIALVVASRRTSSNQVGSMRWFLDSLRQDFELLSRTITRASAPRDATRERSPPSDLAA